MLTKINYTFYSTALFFIATLSLLLLYVFYVLKPSTFDSFSLIDDGQTIQNAEILSTCVLIGNCAGANDILIEKEFGRFRPLYWVIQSTLFKAFDNNVVNLHLVRAYGFSTILFFLIFANIWSVYKSKLAVFTAASIFFTSYSFTENIVRLGPVEPYQLCFLALFSLFYLNIHKINIKIQVRSVCIIMTCLLLAACLIKETTIALLGMIIVFPFLIYRNHLSKMFAFVPLLLAIFLVFAISYAKTEGATDYSGNYQFNLGSIVNSIYNYKFMLTEMYRIYLPVSAVLYIIYKLFLKNDDNSFAIYLEYWILFSLAFIAIQLPWPFIIERYLLLSIFGFSVFFGSIIAFFTNYVIDWVKKSKYHATYIISSYILISTLLSNLFFEYLPLQLAKSLNYSNWYDVYLRFENEQIHYLVSTDSDLSMNAKNSLNNWEVLYELPIHFHYIHFKDYEIELYSPLDKSKFLFISSFLEKGDDDYFKNYTLHETHTYSASQIDPYQFKKKFVFRPIQAIIEPPLKSENLIHKWEVWELQ